MPEKDQIVATFEAHRKTPGAPYVDDYFLDYLLAHPKKKRAVYDSFSGLRRFNAFIDQIQLDFSVCFSLKDREANYSLNKFVARVIELRDSPRSSLISLNNQKKAGFGWQVAALSNLPIAVAAFALKHHYVFLVLCLAFFVILNAFWLSFFVKHKRYIARLHNQLLQASAARPNNSFKPKPLRGSA